ncbi:hypothetical protein ATL17_0095 [Maritalea mobilis]|uniref:Porin n=2 Tax=Maritalea mobilis TaxID=483324 RepID=A0A4R6VU53_9HYPH|nr:hypothetical protein ATL17_0095 [Maritalea mobilis]
MKVKSLFLGSAAAVALSSGAMAADPIGVALDTCSLLNITGLTVSSESNCLKFSGEVSYDWDWDLDAETTTSEFGWEFTMEATADSDFGPAKAVVTLIDESGTSTSSDVDIDEAYVAIGDQTVIMAGQKGSVAKDGDDETFTALFDLDGRDGNDEGIDLGGGQGGHVIQVTSDLGNGVDVALGLEDLSTNDNASLVAGLGVDQDWGTAHVGMVFDDIIDPGTNDWFLHAGATINVDDMSFRGAFSTDDAGEWAIMVAGKATFDMFTLAAGVEFFEDDHSTTLGGPDADTDVEWEAAVSGEAAVNDAVTITVAGRWDDNDEWDVAAQGVFAVSDNLDLTAKVNFDEANVTTFNADLDWAPGGGFEAGVGVEIDSNSNSALSASFSKAFE